MKIAFITTILNEEKNIILLLNSILSQTKRPDEVFIVDGGSKDGTVRIVKEWRSKIRSEEFRNKIKIVVMSGNRSICRNEAIRRSRSEIIVCSDSGCILEKNWIKNITFPFKNPKVDVVAGFYKGLSQSIFEKSLIPYVLVMPDKVNPEKFLPSARSIAFKKYIWQRIGGFSSEFSSNEDFVFARKLRKYGANIIFKKNAIVYFFPRKNIKEAFLMFFRFAAGDSESGILRSKVVLIFIRYILIVWLLIYAYYFRLFFILQVIFYILLLYIIWSILKSYKYVREGQAVLFLPLIQFTSDLAVIAGTVSGFFKGLWDTQKRQ